MNVETEQIDFCQPKLLSLTYKSKEEFAKEYKKCDKTSARDLYLELLIELEKTITEGNVHRFKEISSFIDYISSAEDLVTLRDYFENANNPIKNTNLVILACKHNKLKILEHILGSDSTILNNMSVLFGRTAILPYDKDETCHNAFYYAIRSGNIELLDTLINKWPDNYFAVHLGEIDEIISGAYIELKVSINDSDINNQTLLHYASKKGHLKVVKYLISQGADINAQDADGLTPVHIAVTFNHKDILEVLLKNGAVYNAVDKFHRRPLETANDKNVINLLTSTDKMFEAVKHNSSSEVENYIKVGAFFNSRHADIGTPLHYAAWKGYEEVVNVLLQNKANPNVVDHKGVAPLHYAAKFSHFAVVLALLSNGAVYNAVSDSGKTPLDFSTDERIVSLFKLVSKSFENVKNNNPEVINDLTYKIKDSNIVQAVMGACDRENKTLVDFSEQSNFMHIEELEDILQGDALQVEVALELMKQGNYKNAMDIFKNAFEKLKKIVGSDNPATLNIQTYIAKVLYGQGVYQEALNMLEEIFLKQKEILGLNHNDTLCTRSTIALIFHRQGKDKEAFNIFKKVYQKQKEILGPDHLDTLDTQFHMAIVMNSLGKYEEALSINKETYEKRKEILGENDLVTVHTQNNIAIVLASLGKYEEALKIYKEVFKKKKMILGINNDNTLRTLNNIALAFFGQKKYRKALKTHQEVLNIQKNILEPNHPDTLRTQYSIANVLYAQGKFIGALKAYREGLDQIKRVIGPNHPMILDIKNKIEIINLRFKFEGREESEILQYLQKGINTAAINGDVQTVQRLLKEGADPNYKDIDGKTPLHYAAGYGHIGVVNILLKNGANIIQVTNKGNTPLHLAVSKNYKEIVEVLLQNVSDNTLHDFINAKTSGSGATALHVAAKSGYLDVMKSLMNDGAIYNIKNNEGKTPLDLSKDNNVNYLLKFVEEMFSDAKNGNVDEISSKLSTARPDEFIVVTNVCNNEGNTLLQVAIANGHKNVASKLLQMLS